VWGDSLLSSGAKGELASTYLAATSDAGTCCPLNSQHDAKRDLRFATQNHDDESSLNLEMCQPNLLNLISEAESRQIIHVRPTGKEVQTQKAGILALPVVL
jgi:hypothetical protein